MIDFEKVPTSIENPVVSSESNKDSQSIVEIDHPGAKHVTEDEYSGFKCSISEIPVLKISQKSPGGGGGGKGGRGGGREGEESSLEQVDFSYCMLKIVVSMLSA